MMRATISPALPALTVLMVWIDRVGQVCANVGAARNIAAPPTAPHNVRNAVIVSSLDVLEALAGFLTWVAKALRPAVICARDPSLDCANRLPLTTRTCRYSRRS